MLAIPRKVLFVCAIVLLIISTGAYAESWTSFKFADFTGVSATPEFATNTLIYNLALSDSPTITFDGKTYNISWVQGFYALSTNGTSTFYAGGKNIVDVNDPKNILWKWDTNPNTDSPNYYVVAGWSAQGEADRILTGSDMNFTYTDFSIPTGTSIILGLHVGYYDEGQEKNVTKFFKPASNPPPSVPEAPASLLVALGGPAMGAASLLRKRFGQKS